MNLVLALIAPPSHSSETEEQSAISSIAGPSCLPLFWASNAAAAETETITNEDFSLSPAGISINTAPLAGLQEGSSYSSPALPSWSVWGDRLAGGYLGSDRTPVSQGVHGGVCSALLSWFSPPAFHWGDFKMIKKDSGTRSRVSKGLNSATDWGWMQWQSAHSWEHPPPASKPALTQTRRLLASRAQKHSQVWCHAMPLHRVIKWKNQLSESPLFWSFVSFPLWPSCAPLFTSLTQVNFSLKLIWYEQSSSCNSRNIFSSFFQMSFLPSFQHTNWFSNGKKLPVLIPGEWATKNCQQ